MIMAFEKKLSLLIVMRACNADRSDSNVFDTQEVKFWLDGAGPSCLLAKRESGVSVYECQRDLLKLAW